MQYKKTITLKDGRTCTLRNGDERDGAALLDIYIRTHSQTDYLLSCPGEKGFSGKVRNSYEECCFWIGEY